MALKSPDSVNVRQSPGRGFGVFAQRLIGRGEVIERSPYISVPEREVDSVLANYVYEHGSRAAIGLGFLSLYNHSRRPNAQCYNAGRRVMEIIALRRIGLDEEVTINYGKQYKAQHWY